ncbi:hypothetical protein SAMN05880582_102192 [Rhizobium sp. RU20A]|nr:hypothetical protein SAMN05880582_102192 [Rhizobium sp. RU20A]
MVTQDTAVQHWLATHAHMYVMNLIFTRDSRDTM